MTSVQLIDRLVAIFPEFRPYWEAKNYGSFTLHGVFVVFTSFFYERHELLLADRVAALGTFVSECMAPDDDNLLDNAAATCFVENIAGMPCNHRISPYLTGPARRYWQYFGGQDAEVALAPEPRSE